MIFLYLIYLISFVCFFSVVWRLRSLGLSYLLGFWFFFSTQYGPHTVFSHDVYRHLGGGPSVGEGNIVYIVSLVVFNFIFSLFFLQAPWRLTAFKIPSAVNRSMLSVSSMPTLLVLVVSVVCIMASILMGGISIFVTHLEFMIGNTSFAYVEVRRELFADTSWAAFSNLLRYSLIPLLFGYLFLWGIGKKNIAVLAFAFSLLFLCAIQINKFFYVYYILLAAFIYLLSFGVWSGVVRFSLASGKYFLVLMALVAMLYGLYRFQYRDELVAGIVDPDMLVNTLRYRIFYASSEALRLWIDYFVVESAPAGFSSVSQLCSVTVGQCIDANVLIPSLYVANINTTMQSGFLGSAIAFGGLWAVPIFSMLAVMVVYFNLYALDSIKGTALVYVVSPIMFLNAFFLTTREITTAFLSGGAVFVPLCVLVVGKVSKRYINLPRK